MSYLYFKAYAGPFADKYDVIDTLGTGSFGFVDLCRDVTTNQFCVVRLLLFSLSISVTVFLLSYTHIGLISVSILFVSSALNVLFLGGRCVFQVKFIEKSRMLTDSWEPNDGSLYVDSNAKAGMTTIQSSYIFMASLDRVPREVLLLSRLKHPNIVGVTHVLECPLYFQVPEEKMKREQEREKNRELE